MGILTKEVEIKYFTGGKTLLDSLGYKGLKIHDVVNVEISKLSKSSNIKVECKCDICGEHFKRQLNSINNNLEKFNGKTYCRKCSYIIIGDKLNNTYKESFYDWCIRNNQLNLLSLWDSQLNAESYYDVSCVSHNKYYFKCPRGIHNSELYALSSLTSSILISQNPILCRKCNSFAQWGIDNVCEDFLDKYWDYVKNIVNPWDISISSTNRVWIRCQEVDYHESYEIICYNFKLGNRCSYCSSRLIHPKDSFAQYLIDLYGENALNLYWDYNNNSVSPWSLAKSCITKVWIICQEKDYHGSYEITTNAFNRGRRCPYCFGTKTNYFDSLGYLFPEVLGLWSDKNEKSPYDYKPNSNIKVWWKCYNGKHDEFYRKIIDSKVAEFRCPDCTRERDESLLQEKVRLHLESFNYDLYHEDKCSLYPRNVIEHINMRNMGMLRYDNEIVLPNGCHLFVETNGSQHYKTSGIHKMSAKQYNTTPEYELEYQQKKDAYKRDYVLEHGHYFLEIPYWKIRSGSYIKLIDNKIHEILRTNKGA